MAAEQPAASVVVIGAGIAGLAAARALAEWGYRVTVLEARERAGGRIRSDRSWPGLALDLGAAWIHGRDDNPLAELAEAAGARTVATDYDSLRLWDSDGTPVDGDEYRALFDLFEDMLDDLDDQRELLDEQEADDIPLGDAVEDWLDDAGLQADEIRRLAYVVSTSIEHEYAADIADLSLTFFDDRDAFEGDDLLLPDGFDAIIHNLAEDLDLRLGQVVSAVAQDEDGVRLATTEGEIAADYAVVTLPLGVLKAGDVSFAPPLAAEKLAAIERLGVGTLCKTALRFPRVFWPQEADLLGSIPEQKGQWAEWLNLARVSGQPVLVGLNAADYGREVEGWPDERVVASAMAALRAMFGPDVPDPEAWLVSRWGQDPFARGAYPYTAFGASLDDYEDLAAPDGRLFFAGDATSPDFPATAHGAYLSGLRAAEELDGVARDEG